MVIASNSKTRQRGWLMIELMAAVSLLLVVVFPLAYSIVSERRLARSQYQRAVAMEIVDGEFEVLVSGEWRSFGSGTHDYKVNALSVTNLPPGKFTLSIDDARMRLEWRPTVTRHGGSVVREVKFK